MRGSSKTASEKWGAVRENACIEPSSGVPKKGIRLEKSAFVKDIIISTQKGKRNKNKQRSALRPMLFTPFTQAKAAKKKKAAKEKAVGAVSKKAA